MKKEVVYAFIDSQNLNLGIKNQGWNLDFIKFRRYLTDKYTVNKAFLFLGYIKSNYKLYKFLTNSGYKLIYKQVINIKGKIKGNVDAELIVWAMESIYENKCDKAVVVSGDGDFSILADFLLKKNKLKKFIVPNHKAMSILIKKVFIKNKETKLLDSLNDKKEKLAKERPLYRSGNR